MESKLKLIAELARFSGDDLFPEVSSEEELSLDELELVSAAGTTPNMPSFDEFMKKMKQQ